MVLVSDKKMAKNLTLAIDEVLNPTIFMNALNTDDFSLLRFDFEIDTAYLTSDQSIDALTTYTNIKELDNTDPRNTLLILLFPQNAEFDLDTIILSRVDALFLANTPFLVHQISKIVTLKNSNLILARELKHSEEEVAHQRRKSSEIEILKNAIVRNVSHELRTPLLQVKSAVALIAEDSDDTKLVNYAQYAVARLETHIKNITMLGHSLDISPSPIILRESIEYAKRNLTRIWTFRDEVPNIQILLDKGLPPILADKQGLSTALQLLIDNALKFSDKNGIKVTAKEVGDKVRVAIHDEGIGIDQDKIKNIFDSFYQVDATSTRPYGGTGVGLALVKIILDYHGVDIQVESKVGEGSTFWFDIPALDMSSFK